MGSAFKKKNVLQLSFLSKYLVDFYICSTNIENKSRCSLRRAKIGACIRVLASLHRQKLELVDYINQIPYGLTCVCVRER